MAKNTIIASGTFLLSRGPSLCHGDCERNILLDLSKEYLQNAQLAEVTDKQFGAGCSEYVTNAIKRYY